MKALRALFALLLLASPARADFSKSARGTSAAQFLKLGAGARAAAMGQTGAAFADDATALYWNPASLAGVRRGAVSLMHASLFETFFYDHAAAALPFSGGTFGFAAQYMGMDALDSFDNTGAAAGKFSPKDMAVTAGWGSLVAGLPAGVALKFVRTSIVDSASTLALDFGVRKDLGRWSAGAALQNVGGELTYHQDGDPLPLNLRLGSAYRLGERWLLSADLNAPRDNLPWLGVGAEYLQKIRDGAFAAARLGFNTQAMDLEGARSFTAGLGVDVGGMRVDYAFAPFGQFSPAHRVSLSARFGPERPRPEPAVQAALSGDDGALREALSRVAEDRKKLEERARELEGQQRRLTDEREALLAERKRIEEARYQTLALIEKEKPPEIVAMVTSVAGGVQVKSYREAADWEPALPGRFLFHGDTVRTDPTARAAITFVNGVESKVEENTTFKLGLDAAGEELKQSIDLFIGEIFSKVVPGTKFGIKTPQGKMLVKGTEFFIRVASRQTFVTVKEGVVEASNALGKVDVEPAERSIVSMKETPAAPAHVAPEQIPVWPAEVKVEEVMRQEAAKLPEMVETFKPEKLLADLGAMEGVSVQRAPSPAELVEKKLEILKTQVSLNAELEVADANLAKLAKEKEAAEEKRRASEAADVEALEKEVKALEDEIFRATSEKTGLVLEKESLQKELTVVEQAPRAEEKIRITATDRAVQFAYKSADLSPESRAVLDKIASFLKVNPWYKVEIQGHTDSTGDEASNQQLSERRAEAVRQALLKTPGLSPASFQLKGLGESTPAASNASAEGRAKNRRVELVLKESHP